METTAYDLDKRARSLKKKELTCRVAFLLCGVAIGVLVGTLATYFVTKSENNNGTTDAQSANFASLTADAEDEDDNSTVSTSMLMASVSTDADNVACTVTSQAGTTCVRGGISGYHIGTKGLDLIKSFEGFYSNFYIDPVGIRTIGYGHACHSSPCSGGIFTKGYITKDEAVALLQSDLIEFENCVKNYITVPLTNNEFDALVSFSYNTGCGALQGSTLRRLLNQNDYASVPAQLNRCGTGINGRVPGVVLRRKAEGDLFQDQVCGSLTPPVTAGTVGVCKPVSACTGSVISGLCPGSAEIQCCYNEPLVDDSCLVSGKQGRCTAINKCSGTLTPSTKCSGGTQCCLQAAPKPPDACTTSGGATGTCMDTSDCQARPGTSFAGLCSGPTNIQCCVDTVPATCTSNGAKGKCLPTTSCLAPNSSVPGLCPGPSTIQCCIPPPTVALSQVASCVVDGVQGSCKDTASCGTGFKSVAGFCPGAANIQCCVPVGTTCRVQGTQGSCIDVNSCVGTVTSNLCPGAANIKCCTSGSSPITQPQCDNLGPVTYYDAYSQGNYLGRIATVKVQGKNVEKNTACVFTRMRAASGLNMVLNSGFRTMAEQQYLWNCYQTKQCNNGNLAARPGFSNHQNGIALDIATGGGVFEWLTANGKDWGFKRTVPSENWHWEYRPNEV